MANARRPARVPLQSLRTRLTTAASGVLETLEERRLTCADHAGHLIAAPVAMDIMRRLGSNQVHKAAKPTSAQTKATKTVTLTRASVTKSVAKAVDAEAAAVAAAAVADPVTFAVTAAGLPILNSRPDGQGLKVFIDWDGANGDQGFSTDGDLTTFNAAEQAVIYGTWRDIVSEFSMLNVNVTTVQPPVGGNNPNFVWQRITNSVAGGAAYVNWIVNYESHGYNNSDNALYRHSGIYHELGHQMGLDHQSAYDDAGNKTAEYINGYDTLHGATMGIDYNGNIKKWIIGRDTYAADSFQDDLDDMGGVVGYQTGTDGFKPDDFTGTTLSTATTLPITNGAYQTAGNIERLFDADYFSFTSTGGAWNVNVEPTYNSPVELKLEVYNTAGTLLGSVSDGLYRNAQDNASQDLNFNLPAGNYVAKVTSAQNAGDQGEYAFYATPLPGGWQSVDVNRGNTGRGGYVTYDGSTGTYVQGGSGSDIWTTSDAFRYSYQTLTGDGSITARVDRLDNTAAFAKAGVMIRQSTAANSAHVYYGIKPGGEIEAIARATTGGTAYNNFGGGSTGPWVRLTRAGNLFTIARSADGVTWTTAGSTVVAMTGPVTIGLAACSNNFGAQTTSSFSNVTVTGNLGPTTPTFNGLAAPANLTVAPAATQTTNLVLNWADVSGETGYRIERSLDNNTFAAIGTVTADATTYTDTASGWGSMRYFYRVTALTSGGFSTYSNVATAVNKPGQSFLLQAIKLSATRVSISWRDVNGDSGYRVERSGNGGTTYSTLGTTPQNVALFNDNSAAAGTAYTYRVTPLSQVGDGVPFTFNVTTQLPATSSISLSNSTATSLTVNWSAVANAASYRVYRSTDNANWTQITTFNSGSTVSYAEGGLNALTNYYYYVVAVASDGAVGINSAVAKGSTAPTAANALPSPWAEADVGTVTGIGKAGSAGANAFSVNTSGSDIANPDGFHFVYQPVTGNATVIARIAALGTSDAAAKAGLMIRQDVTSVTAAYAGIFINAGNGYGIDLRSRATAGAGYQYSAALANVAAPYWLKIVRAGTTFQMSYSTDGVSWTVAGSRTVSMTGTVYVGLATTAFSSSLMNTASFTNVAVGAPSAAPTVAVGAAASPSPVTGKTTNVSVLGADDGGEANLAYGWTATGPAAVTFSATGTNAAKNAVATFAKAGTYTLTAAISDGLSTTTSSTTVVVSPTFTGIAAAQASMLGGFTQQISPADQFGSPMTVGGVAWSASNGAISGSGVYTAPAVGSSTVTITGTIGSTPYITSVAVVGPRAWYKADTVAGGTLADASGNANNGALTQTYALDANGAIGSGVTVGGGYATVPNGIVSGLTDLTISSWVKPTATNQWARLFDFGTGTTKYMFLAPTAGDGFLRFAATNNGGGSEQTVTTSTAIANNVWTHIALTISGTVAMLYVNGTAVGSNANFTLNPAALGAMTQTWLGRSQYPDPAFQGGIDDFRVYGGAANGANVAALYASSAASKTGVPTNLAAARRPLGGANLTWLDNSASETAYLVERSTTAAFTAGLTTFTAPAGSTSFADTTAATGTTYYYRVSAVFAGGTTGTPSNTATLTPAAAPTLTGVIVNDGSTQRSMISSLTVNFSAAVTLGSGAISVSGVGGNVPFALVPLNGGTAYQLNFAGQGLDSDSLTDGRYTLHVDHSAVSSGGAAMDADSDFAFFRLFGDNDGDAGVSINDFNTFATAFGSLAGNPAFVKAFDFDNDNGISINDFNALSSRFGRTV